MVKYAPRKVFIKESGRYVELSYMDFCRRRESDQTYMDNDDNLPEELACIYSRRIRKEETRIERLTNYLATYYFKDFEAHVLQCKTNWNDSIQAPMLWSLIYYLSRDGITLPTGSNIKFGSGLYTLPR